MIDRCFDLSELDDLLDLPPDDPRREHLSRCPLCSARVEAFKVFLRNQPASGSRPEEARAALEALVTRLVRPQSGPERVVSPRRRFWQFGPLRYRWIAVPVTAAAAAVILYLTWAPGNGPEGPSGRLRVRPSPAVTATVVSETSEARPDGAVALHWRSLPDADSYRVQLLNSSLDEVASFAAGADTALVLHSDQLPGGTRLFLWRVQAMRGGMEVGRSRLATLDLRRSQRGTSSNPPSIP